MLLEQKYFTIVSQVIDNYLIFLKSGYFTF